MGSLMIKIFVNALTVFRCFFTFAMPFLIEKVSNITFLGIVGILFFTDCLDGFISRTCKVQTLFGSIMDTIADKVLCIVLILCISTKSNLLLAIGIGEMIIAVINLAGTANGATIMSIMTGKIKMWALAAVTIVGYLYFFEKCDEIYVNIIGTVVILMQAMAILKYGKIIWKAKEIRKEKVKYKRGKELVHALFNTEYYLNTINEPILKKITIN